MNASSRWRSSRVRGVLVEVHRCSSSRRSAVRLLGNQWLAHHRGSGGRAGAQLFDPAAAFVDLHGGDRSGHVAVAPLERVEQHPLMCDGDVATGGIGAEPRPADVLAAELEGAKDGAEGLVSGRVVHQRPEPAMEARRSRRGRWPARAARPRRASRPAGRRSPVARRAPPPVGSSSRRTSTTSSRPCDCRSSIANTMPDNNSLGARLVTYVPSPRRTSSTLICESARTASRSDPRDTPSRSASSCSGGSRSPGLSSPERIIARMLSIALRGDAHHKPPMFRLSASRTGRRHHPPFRIARKAALANSSVRWPAIRHRASVRATTRTTTLET